VPKFSGYWNNALSCVGGLPRTRRVDAPILPAPMLLIDHVQWEYPGFSRSRSTS
jgi:hypothetical protein